MRVTKFITAIVAATIFSAAGFVQNSAGQTATITHVPIRNAPANSGKAMFNSYCAVCHGADGKGSGPAASALKTAPADLTALAAKNAGKYPAGHVAATIKGQATLASHGTQDMPIWGPLFSSIDQGREAQTQQRIANLVAYIGTLQAK